jgi:hypothetical protein
LREGASAIANEPKVGRTTGVTTPTLLIGAFPSTARASLSQRLAARSLRRLLFVR